MTQQVIDVGSAPNDGTGDSVRDAGAKINANFTELYSLAAAAPVVAQSAVAAQTALGNTGEQTLATVTIPAGLIGPNGQVEIETLWSHPNSANNKVQRIRFGGTLVQGSTRSTTLSSQQRVRVSNRNAANSQVSQATNIDGTGAVAAAVTTMAIDTTAAVNITMTGQPASASEQMTLESYRVVVWPKD